MTINTTNTPTGAKSNAIKLPVKASTSPQSSHLTWHRLYYQDHPRQLQQTQLWKTLHQLWEKHKHRVSNNPATPANATPSAKANVNVFTGFIPSRQAISLLSAVALIAIPASFFQNMFTSITRSIATKATSLGAANVNPENSRLDFY